MNGYEGKPRRITEEVVVLGFGKKSRAKHDLDVALHFLLWGREEIVKDIRAKFKNEWDGFIDDILNGANVNFTGVMLLQVYLQTTLNEEEDEEKTVLLIDAILDEEFKDRPLILDVIAQVGYFSMLLEDEKENPPPNGTSSNFITNMAKLFCDEGDTFEQVREYFVQSTVRFREEIKASVGK